MNDTECPVQIPGFTHNGDCNLLCKSTEWKDIVTFFLGNYGAHVATVVGRPGQSSLSWMFSLLLALCFPGAGVLTGLQAITSMALFAPTELTKAARAGALCIVVKVDQKPNGGERDLEASGQGVNGSLPSGQKAPSNASREDLFFPTASRSADEAIDLGPQPDVSQHRDEANDHQASAGALLQHHGGSIEINRPDTGQDRASRDDDRSQMTSQRSMAAHETALGEQPDECKCSQSKIRRGTRKHLDDVGARLSSSFRGYPGIGDLPPTSRLSASGIAVVDHVRKRRRRRSRSGEATCHSSPPCHVRWSLQAPARGVF